MRRIAGTPQNYSGKIRECWGFDSLYNTGDETFWADWARTRPGARLFFYYGSGGIVDRALRLRRKNVPNILVDGSVRLAHNHVPIKFWQTRLMNSPFLLNK